MFNLPSSLLYPNLNVDLARHRTVIVVLSLMSYHVLLFLRQSCHLVTSLTPILPPFCVGNPHLAVEHFAGMESLSRRILAWLQHVRPPTTRPFLSPSASTRSPFDLTSSLVFVVMAPALLCYSEPPWIFPPSLVNEPKDGSGGDGGLAGARLRDSKPR
eukprot:c22097_g1_i1 orf=472-945(+)